MGPQERLAAARRRSPLLDHAVRTQEHYGTVQAAQQAGAVTYFAFLSFFPLLALGFFTVGLISRVYPDADADLVAAIDSVLPGVLGEGVNQLSLDDVADFSGLAGVVGLVGVLYAGLGWVSALRTALVTVFSTPREQLPNFVRGKLRDLEALVVIGLVLVLSVAVAGFVAGFSADLLDLLGLDATLGWLVRLLAVVVGLGANMVLFFAMFRLLAEPRVPPPVLWQAAAIGAVGFELLKQLSGLLLAGTQGQPAFQAFGIALILVVWINYFSRLVLYAAAWAQTSPRTRDLLVHEPVAPVQGPSAPPEDPDPETPAEGAEPVTAPALKAGVPGFVAGLGVGLLLRRRR
ncbi:YihY/virulence factor BrkB family protein [Nocardioides sp.]|uniref:YihY/virulence factor BrkB family protein n=1 Tax=Nocardioides sp. TaxID=35761 RepID=UPI0035169E4F